MKTKPPNISGQWLGYFKYGPEYGDLHGEKVSFSLVLEELPDGQFRGRCYELEGVGVNNSDTFVNGYVQENAIHFLKEYTKDYDILDDRTLRETSLQGKPILTYDGEFDFRVNAYVGQWELEVNLGQTVKGDLLDILTGTWEITKVNIDG